MNNRQARLFAVGSTALAALIFLVLTLDSHRQFPELTHSENITPQVTHGKDVWHKYNCINCHTLFGEGAYYAPDLTKITELRGEAYLQAYMRDPSQFYDEQTHRRLMPQQNLSDEEITDLIAFLNWVSKVDNQGWPPRPIRVTGAPMQNVSAQPFSTEESMEGSADKNPSGTTPVTAEDDYRAQGESVFQTAIPACTSCHSTAPGVNMAGPTMAGVASRARETLQSEEYTGDATDVEGYLREAIVAPSAHIASGGMYSSGATSFMPPNYNDSLSEEEIEQLVAYLATLK